MTGPSLEPRNESVSSDSPNEAFGEDDSERTTAGVACNSSGSSRSSCSVLSSNSSSSVLSTGVLGCGSADSGKADDGEDNKESESLPESSREQEIGERARSMDNNKFKDRLRDFARNIEFLQDSSRDWLPHRSRDHHSQNRGRYDAYFGGAMSLPPFLFEQENSMEENHGTDQNDTHANIDIETTDETHPIDKALRTFILKTTYPSSMNLEHQKYPVVCDANGIPNKALDCMKLAAQTHEIIPPRTGFMIWDHAVIAAAVERDKCSEFSGFCDVTAPPPWDSSRLKDNGRDADVIIDVVGYNQLVNTFDNQREAKEYLDEKYGCYKNVLEIEESAMRVAAAGVRAFYSYPVRKFWDKPADMEIRETANWKKDMLKKIRPDSGSMSSLMYRGHNHGSLGRFLSDLCAFKKCVASEVGILRHLLCIDKLEELFLEMNIATKNEGPVERRPPPSNSQHCLADRRQPLSKHFILHLAPQLKNLKVLSFGIGFKLLPQTLITISDTMMLLERLDISHALSVEYSLTPSVLGERELGEGEKHHMFYEFALPKCVSKLSLLVRLDIGDKVRPNPSDEEGTDADSVVISSSALSNIEAMLASRGGYLTRSHQTLPPAWPHSSNENDERKYKLDVLRRITSNSKIDPDLRNIAFKELRTLTMRDSSRSSTNNTVIKPIVNYEEIQADLCRTTYVNISANKRRCEGSLYDSFKIPRLP